MFHFTDMLRENSFYHKKDTNLNNGVVMSYYLVLPNSPLRHFADTLMMIRTCSSDLSFDLTMIDGVCRSERSGNGYICMCGKHLCNSATLMISLSSKTIFFVLSVERLVRFIVN